MKRTEFERVTPESVGISSQAIDRFIDKLEGGHTEMHGLMIMRHGKVCAEGWWTPFAPGLHHMCNSLTKTYMGAAIGVAYTEGLLKLEDRLIDIFPEYIPENPSEYIDNLTVRNVLCMGSGMTQFPPASENWVRDFIAVPLVNKPGTAFFYNSVGSTFLGKIIEKLTGKNVYEYLSEKVFSKIGIDSENLTYGIAPAEMDMWAWRTVSTTEDNLRLMKLFADGGVWDGERIIADDYVKLATTFQNDNSRHTETSHLSDSEVGYGFQMWMCKPEGAYRADGAGGQFSIVLPKQDMIVSINESAIGSGAQTTLDCVWDYLLPELHDEPLPEDEAAVTALRRRLSHLGIAAPKFQPYSEKKATASGKYKVVDGSFDLWCKGLGRSSNMPSADWFSIRFDNMFGHIDWMASDRGRVSIDFAMNGSRRQNFFDSRWEFAQECFANGYWQSEDEFVLELLWPENASNRTLYFKFEDDRAIVSEKGMSGPPTPGKPMLVKTTAIKVNG